MAQETERLGSGALHESGPQHDAATNGASLDRRRNDLIILLLLVIQLVFNVIHAYNERDHYLLLIGRQDRIEDRQQHADEERKRLDRCTFQKDACK